MLFASTSLARRIERAECRLMVDVTEAVRSRRPEDRAVIVRVGEAAAVYAGEGSPFNKLIGLGFEPLDEEALASAERAFVDRRAPLQVEFSSLADHGISAALTRRGYALVGFEDVLGLRVPDALQRPAAPEATPGDLPISIAPPQPEESRLWLEVICSGFADQDTFDGPAPHDSFTRETVERAVADTIETPGVLRYLARRGGEPAGAASVRHFEGVAQLCGAATLLSHRRRGVQSALLRARLVDAAEAGCDIAVVTTHPGSKSHENVQKAGFELLYTRAILVRSWN